MRMENPLQLLSWRPAYFAASKQMKVQVKDTLPGVRANVGQETIATLIYAHFMRQLPSSHEDFGKYRSILDRHVRHGGYMTARNHHNVTRRPRVDILKRHDVLVL